MSVFYGVDTNCVTDVPLIDVQVTDPIILIGQRIARRLTTPRGGLASVSDDPNFGWDVRQYTNGRLRPSEKAAAAAVIAAECKKDEQVQDAIVSVFLVNGGALTISIDLLSSAGPFSLTMNVSNLSVSAVFNF